MTGAEGELGEERLTSCRRTSRRREIGGSGGGGGEGGEKETQDKEIQA